MSLRSSSRLREVLLLSASSLSLLVAVSAPTRAQPSGNAPQTPAATPTPQPSASPTPAPENGATAAPAEQPAAPTAQQQTAGGTVLPTTHVAQPVQRPKGPRPPRQVATNQRQMVTNQPSAPAPTPEQVQAAANRQVVQQTQNFNERRDNVILPKIGASTYRLSQTDIENLPQGNAIQFSDLALQLPGVYQDSTSQDDFHIRNEHGNVQYRINGILLPDGVSGFSQILETSFIGNMQLLTGALPAQYGLHTSGIIDITSKSGAALSGGSVTVYGGSRQTISPSFEYGGVEGRTDYYVTGRYLSTASALSLPRLS